MARSASTLIEAFNALLESQKKDAPAARVSVLSFNERANLIQDGVPLREITPLSADTYSPLGGTALNDGIGELIGTIAARADRVASRVIIAILSDGGENASQTFTASQIRDLIAYRRLACNWQFVFLGASEALIMSALRLGIQRPQIACFQAGPQGVKAILDKLSQAVTAYRLGDKDYQLLLKN
jgi:hypothetical protein